MPSRADDPSGRGGEQSREWRVRAERSLAGGVSSHFRAADPIVFARGQGSRLWDVDGREYLDFTLSQGPLIHGHSPPAVVEAASEAMRTGQVTSGVHPDEIRLAEKLVEIIPCAELVRLAGSGSEAVHAALRLARAYTGRPKVIKFEGHYHGWFDNVAGSVNPSLDAAGPDDEPSCVPWTSGLTRGAVDDLIVLTWNDVEAIERAIEKHRGQIAGVITEPIMCNAGCIEPRPGFLQSLRRTCDEHEIVLIFDEVITGFRVALGGAQGYYGVTPDLAIFGKALAAGFPISALVGRRSLMEFLGAAGTIHAGTLNANLMCVAACLASVRLLERDGGAAYRCLRELGRRLMEGLSAQGRESRLPVHVQGLGPVFHMGFLRNSSGASAAGGASADTGVAADISNYRDVVRCFDNERYGRFVAAMRDGGVRLIGRGIWYLSTAHTDADIDETLAIARRAMSGL